MIRLNSLPLLVFLLSCCIKSHAQQLTLLNKDISLEKALLIIQQQCGYSFFWDKALVAKQLPVTVTIENASLPAALDACLRGSGLTYEIKGNLVFIKPRPEQRYAVNNTSPPAIAPPPFKTGKIFDEQKRALSGVTIMNGKRGQGTQSDSAGNFKIEAAPGDILEFSYIGYQQKQYKVKEGEEGIIMDMKLTDFSLEESVVVGYGTQKRLAVTGSVAVIGAGSIANRPVSNLSSSLAGLAAGVYVRQLSGRPGNDGATAMIRGVGTLSNTVSLVLIDGIIGNIDEVNPYDVESITILKDASTAAIYGALSSNGVILVTTKKPGNKRPVVSYTGMISRTRPNNLVRTVSDMPTYMTYLNEANQNIGNAAPFSQTLIDQWRHASQYPDSLTPQGIPFHIAYPNTDWAKALIRSQRLQNHNISLKGGSKDLKYFFSLGYLDNQGLIVNSGMKRYLFRANAEARIAKGITIGTHTFGGTHDLGMAGITELFWYLGRASPGTYPDRYQGVFAAPSLASDFSSNLGAFPYLALGSDRIANFNTTWYGKAFLLPNLSFEPRVNYQAGFEKINGRIDPSTTERWNWLTNRLVEPAMTADQLNVYATYQKNYTYTLEGLLRYHTSIRQKHHIEFFLGYNENYNKFYTSSSSKLASADINDYNTSYKENNTMRSFFGRFSYHYFNKYFFNLNLRRDGSSRFGSDIRYGTFPGVSAAWRISEEKFMQPLKNRIQELKWRASYGLSGNTASGSYDWQAIYYQDNYSFNGAPATGIAQMRLANPDLGWERAAMMNLGLEVSAFHHWNFVAEWYRRYTDKILVTPAMDPTAGVKLPSSVNLAEVINCGTELSVGWKQQLGAFSWSVAGSAAYNYLNRVEKYKGRLQQSVVTDVDGNRVVVTNIKAVSWGLDTRIIEGHMIDEYYLKTVYKGTGSYTNATGAADPNGGPKDGMIRTPEDLNWVKAMIDQGYKFYQAQTIAGVRKAGFYYGDLIYADNNKDGIYGNDGDELFTGATATPRYVFGLAVNASRKAFDFSMLWAGATGISYLWNELYQNSTLVELGAAIPSGIATGSYYYNDNNPSGPANRINGTYPRLTPLATSGNIINSDFWLYNASYFKLKNVQLGYTAPLSSPVNKIITGMRVFVSGENLLTFTSFRGMDPEIGAIANYPTMRQYALGINITF